MMFGVSVILISIFGVGASAGCVFRYVVFDVGVSVGYANQVCICVSV